LYNYSRQKLADLEQAMQALRTGFAHIQKCINLAQKEEKNMAP
jgi:hypothetical protein